jgi:hypothetical protein
MEFSDTKEERASLHKFINWVAKHDNNSNVCI